MGHGKRKYHGGGGGGGKREKKANGEGEYPPAHVLESTNFESYYRENGVVPPEEFDAFLACLKQPLGVSFRITGHHEDPEALSLCKHMEEQYFSKLQDCEMDGVAVPPPQPIDWYPGRLAWRFDVSRSVLRGKGAIKDDQSVSARSLAAFHAFLMAEVELGTISRQEEVSMVPPRLADVRPGHAVADLCAAPGSKTQQLIELVNPPTAAEAGSSECFGPSGLVIANDMDYRRSHLLVHQAKRLNSPALIVTNHDATMLPTKMAASLQMADGVSERSLKFDRVLCDVPCSGDGTLRKAPDLWRRWNDGLGLGVHRMQLNILIRGLHMLKPGGRLVYSTCSMNPIEDEAVVAAALLALGGPPAVEIVDVSETLPGLKRLPGMSTWRVRNDINGAKEWYESYEQVPEKQARSRIQPSMFPPSPSTMASLNIHRCVRVLPHTQDTGGFFIAVIERSATVDVKEPEEAPPAKSSARALAAAAEPGAKVFVGNLALEVVWQDLKDHFRAAGEVVHADVMQTPEGRSKECGMVTFATASEAANAVATLHQTTIAGREIFVRGWRDDRTEAAAAPAVDEAANGADAGGGASGAAAEEGGEGGEALVSRIPQQKGQQPGAHVQGILHCSPRNNGKYDALYSLRQGWLEEMRAFFGLSPSFPVDQFVSRSVGGKAIFLIGAAILRLLSADTTTKLKLVNTGIRVLVKLERREEGLSFKFGLAQEGVRCLVPHMTKQRVFASTTDILNVLRRRTMPISSFKSEALKASLVQAEAGAVAIVHDAEGLGSLPHGKSLPLVLAATKSTAPGHAAVIELVVKTPEAASLYNRTANQPAAMSLTPGGGTSGGGGEAAADVAEADAAAAPMAKEEME